MNEFGEAIFKVKTRDELIWNEAIEAAIKVVLAQSCGECDYSKIYAREIEKLRK